MFPSPLLLKSLVLLSFLVCGFIGRFAWSAPKITNVDIRGICIGAQNSLVVSGMELSKNPKLYAPCGIGEQSVERLSDSQVKIDFSIADHVAPDIYPFYLVTESGISNPVLIGADHIPETKLRSDCASFPASMTGQLTGGQIHKIAVTLSKGQTFVVDVEGKRLGSSIRPIIRLYNSKGRQVAWARPNRRILGDARLSTIIEESGPYVIELHDEVYKGPNPGFFRMKIGELSFADVAFPTSVSPSMPTKIKFPDAPFNNDSLVYTTSSIHQLIKVNLPREQVDSFTGSCPVITVVGGLQQHMEEKVDGATKTAAPVIIHGQIGKPGEVDQFQIQVKPETKYNFQIWSHRLGTPLDSVLTITDSHGKELVKNDDHAKSLDPGIDFTVPKGVSHLGVGISSLAGNYGEDCIYALRITEATTNGFELSTAQDRISVATGNRWVIPIQVSRTGYQGRLHLELENSKGPVKSPGAVCHPGNSICLFPIEVSQFTAAILPLKIRATAIDSEYGITKLVNTSGAGLARNDTPWKGQILMAIQSASLPLANVEWNSAHFIHGAVHSLDLHFTKPPENAVRVSLLTSHPIPKKKEGNKQVDDINRTLRLTGATEFDAPNQSVQLKLAVPHDLPKQKWSFAIQTDFLSADKKQVLATIYSSVLSRTPLTALTVQLESAAKPKIKIGESKLVAFSGRINRLDGFSLPVELQITGLPKEISAPPPVIIPADQSTFEVAVSLENQKDAKSVKNLRLQSKFSGEVEESFQEIRGNEIPLEIELVK